MYAGRDFDVFSTGEKQTIGFDFVNDLPTGDSLSAAAFTLTVEQGTDSNPASRLDGLPNIVGTTAIQTLNGLVANCNYILTCTANTTLGSTLVLWSHVRCLPPS